MISIVAAILSQTSVSQVTPADFWLPIGASEQAAGVDVMFNAINYICYFL